VCAAGSDGVTFEAIEAQGVEAFLGQIQSELQRRCYVPRRPRGHEIPKEGGKVRTLSIPSIRDRVVQGALKLIVEPVFEADFQPGSYGYRPRRTAHEALVRVAEAIALGKTHVIDLDLRSYFDGIRHHLLLEKVAKRINDEDVMHLLKLLLKANGKRGVGQGSVLAPLLSNLYLNEVDRMLERAKEYTRFGQYTGIEYARFADDLVVLIHAHPNKRWLLTAVPKRLRQELAKLQVQINEQKSRNVDLVRGESFGFLGFDFRRVRSPEWAVAPAVHAEAEEAHGAAPPATRDLLAISIPTRAVGGDSHQSDPAGLGELLCHRPLESLLPTRQTLGGAEGPAPSAARPDSSRLWLGAVGHLATVRRVWSVQRLSRASGSALGTARPTLVS